MNTFPIKRFIERYYPMTSYKSNRYRIETNRITLLRPEGEVLIELNRNLRPVRVNGEEVSPEVLAEFEDRQESVFTRIPDVPVLTKTAHEAARKIGGIDYPTCFLAFLTGLSASAQYRFLIEPYDNPGSTITAGLYTVLEADTGAGKTTLIDMALGPVRDFLNKAVRLRTEENRERDKANRIKSKDKEAVPEPHISGFMSTFDVTTLANVSQQLARAGSSLAVLSSSESFVSRLMGKDFANDINMYQQAFTGHAIGNTGVVTREGGTPGRYAWTALLASQIGEWESVMKSSANSGLAERHMVSVAPMTDGSWDIDKKGFVPDMREWEKLNEKVLSHPLRWVNNKDNYNAFFMDVDYLMSKDFFITVKTTPEARERFLTWAYEELNEHRHNREHRSYVNKMAAYFGPKVALLMMICRGGKEVNLEDAERAIGICNFYFAKRVDTNRGVVDEPEWACFLYLSEPGRSDKNTRLNSFRSTRFFVGDGRYKRQWALLLWDLAVKCGAAMEREGRLVFS